MHDRPADITYYCDKDLAVRYKVSRSTIWRWTGSGHLPPPVKLGPGCTRWRSSDLDAWEAQQRGAA